MNNIQVKVLGEFGAPAGTMMFLARLTQRGHKIKNMDELVSEYVECIGKEFSSAGNVARLPHGTIKRFTPITVAIVGASRRFLAQARTHSIGLDFVSASLQYSDYSDSNSFVVPYELIKIDSNKETPQAVPSYLAACEEAMKTYKFMVDSGVNNDTAGYVAPQSLRNILVITGNHEAWCSFLNKRLCNRNTDETKYVAALIWKALQGTQDAETMFKYVGPDCMYGACREGFMSCCDPVPRTITSAQEFINIYWPLLNKERE